MIYRFETFELDGTAYELRQNGTVLNVEKQVFDLLFLFVTSADKVLTKDDIIETVWNGRIISDSAINSRISAVRSIIGDSGREQRLIKTIHNQGFRFIGDVEAVSPGPATQDAIAHIKPSNEASVGTPRRPKQPRRIWPFLGGIVTGAAVLGAVVFAAPTTSLSNVDSYSPWQQNLPTESYLARDAYLRGIALREKSYSAAMGFAADQFQIAIDNDPSFAPAYAGLAVAYAEIYNNDPSANLLLKERIDQTLAEAKALSPSGKEVRVADGQIAALRHNYAQALSLANQVIGDDAHYLPAYLLKGEALYQTGRAQEAIDTMGVAISMAPLSPDILQLMSEIKLAMGDFDGSFEAANANVWWNPDSTKSLVAMAKIQYNKAQYETAFYYLERAKDINPLESATQDELITLYSDIGMPEQRDKAARTNIQEALVQAMMGETQDAWALLGNLDIEDMPLNLHYFLRQYDYAVKRYNIYLANHGDGGILPGHGLQYVRMCYVFDREQTAMKDQTCNQAAQYYADKTPADFSLYKDILGGSAYRLMNDDTEAALQWLNYLVQKGHIFMRLKDEPVFAKFNTVEAFQPVIQKMLSTAEIQQTHILEKLPN